MFWRGGLKVVRSVLVFIFRACVFWFTTTQQSLKLMFEIDMTTGTPVRYR